MDSILGAFTEILRDANLRPVIGQELGPEFNRLVRPGADVNVLIVIDMLNTVLGAAPVQVKRANGDAITGGMVNSLDKAEGKGKNDGEVCLGNECGRAHYPWSSSSTIDLDTAHSLWPERRWSALAG